MATRIARTRTRIKDTGRYVDSLTGLVNTISGIGTARDKAISGTWFFNRLDDQQLEFAYRSNWMARKAVDIPAFDMYREGWQWQGEDDAIEAIEELERKHQVAAKVFNATRLARLYGGSGILISDGSENPGEPLNPEAIRRDGLEFITVLSRRFLRAGEFDRDPMSASFGEPLYYDISTGTRGGIRVHPSRVVRFIGSDVPDAIMTDFERWGDSILDSVNIAIRDATSGQQGIADLIQEAKLDVIKVPNLTANISSQEYENRLVRRFGLAMQGKSSVNALILDAEEEYEQKTANFGSLPDVLRLLLQVVSGAADIPVTRFLGQSPAGLQSTGESDIRNYYDRLAAEQELKSRPCLQRIFDVLVRSALGAYPDDLHFTFNPLWQMDEKESAEVAKMEAETDAIYATNALVPSDVLEEAIKNRLIERGRYPGIEAAYEEFGAEPDLDVTPPEDDPDEEEDPEPDAV